MGLMRIASGNDGCPAWATGADGEESIIETHAGISQFLNVRCFDVRVSVGSAVVPGHVIGDDEHDIRAGVSMRVSQRVIAAGKREQ